MFALVTTPQGPDVHPAEPHGRSPAPPEISARKRIDGLDIARAFAIIGMVIVNFKVTMGTEGTGPSWLETLAATVDGRAAATFVVLAGIGASLGSRRARESGDPQDHKNARVTLLRRAAFLFVLGWMLYAVWPPDILHFYGVYLAVGAVLLFAQNRWLVAAAIVSMVISFVFIVSFDYFANWNLTDLSYDGITTPAGFLRNLFLDGFHPVFPWVSFYIFGMWLGRTDLRDAQWLRTLAIRAGLVVVVTEVLAWFIVGPKGSTTDLADNDWRWLLSVDPIPPMTLYLFAGAGTAVLVIVGSIWLGRTIRPTVIEPLVSTGQLALTIYIAHVLVGMAILEAVGRLENQTLSFALAASFVFSVTSILFAWAWRKRFRRGPFEALMRRIAG